MDPVVSLLLGAALTWTWYFVRRRIEQKRTTEAIERSTHLLALKRALDSADLDIEELRQFESRLIGKAETAVRIAGECVAQAESVARQNADDATSQDEMIRQALADVRTTEARLSRLLAHLRAALDDDARAAFEQAHQAWLAYRERYANFVAQSYCAGAIRPLIRAVTLQSATHAWISELETQLGDEDAPWTDAAGTPDLAPALPPALRRADGGRAG